MAADDILIAALRVTGALSALRVPHFLTGSLASSLHGVPRTTQDVDLVADLRPEHVAPLVRDLESDCFVEEDAVRAALRHEAPFHVVHLESAFLVDVFASRKDAWSLQQMARRQTVELVSPRGASLAVASAEEVLLSKLRWFSEGGGVSDQ